MNSESSILGMALIKENHLKGIKALLKDLENRWGLLINNYHENESGHYFTINEESVILGFADFQIPSNDIEYAFNITYDLNVNDKNYFNHKSHLIISVLPNNSDIIERFSLFSKIIISIFNSTNTFSYYYGDANKLFEKDQILNKEVIIKNGKLPLDLWINFIVDKSDEKFSVFTNGLEKFKRLEIELLNSPLDLDYIYSLIYDSIHYILLNNEELKNNDTIGYFEENKIIIKVSPGIYVNKDSVKLIMEKK